MLKMRKIIVSIKPQNDCQGQWSNNLKLFNLFIFVHTAHSQRLSNPKQVRILFQVLCK